MSTKKRRAPRPAPAPAPAPRPSAAPEYLRGLALATASGVLWFLSCADFDIWPLAWFASVPGLYAIERASTTRRGVLFGWVSGVVANAGGFYWITNLLERFGHIHISLSILLFLLLCAYQAVVFALFAWATRRIRAGTRLPMTLVAPVVMVTFELCVPFIFPWYLAITQAWRLHVIQVADLTGPLGVTGLLMMANGAIYDVLTRRRAALVPGAAAAAVLAGALVYGHVRLGQMEARRAAAPHIKVGLVQGNVPFNEKGIGHPQLARDQLFALQQRSRELEAAGADLIVWTESSFPYWIRRDEQADDPPVVRAPIRRENGQLVRSQPVFTTPLIFGAVTYDHEDDDPRKHFPHNSALMLDRDGRFTGRFDKIFLLMFGEYIPGLETFPWLRKILPATAGHFARGKEIVTFPFTSKDGAAYRLGPMICYEDILPAFGRKLAALHPHLMVNITNDAWFGATSEPWEHLALSVYRSVELRSEMVRAVNTGVSAHVDLTGRVDERTYAIDPLITPRPADKLMTEVALVEGGYTVYSRVGDIFGYACTAVTGLLIILTWSRRRAKSKSP